VQGGSRDVGKEGKRKHERSTLRAALNRVLGHDVPAGRTHSTMRCDHTWL
jgi:hypothetical protein